MLLSLIGLAWGQAPFDPGQNPGPWNNLRLEANGLSVHALQAGDVGPPVLLLHGFPDFSHGWRGVIPELSKDHRVLAPDLRGYAGTDRPEGPYDMDTLVMDLAGVMDAHYPDERVHLIAHDWGAAIAWEAAAEFPDRFESITVLSVPHPAALHALWQTSKEQRRYGRFVKRARNKLAPAVLSRLKKAKMRRLFYEEELVDDAVLTDADMDRYFSQFDAMEQLEAPLKYYREALVLPKKNGGAPVLGVSQDVLAIWGSEDSYMLAALAEMSCAVVLGRCEYEVFEGAGHWVHWEKPVEITKRWRTFVYGDSMRPDLPETQDLRRDREGTPR